MINNNNNSTSSNLKLDNIDIKKQLDALQSSTQNFLEHSMLNSNDPKGLYNELMTQLAKFINYENSNIFNNEQTHNNIESNRKNSQTNKNKDYILNSNEDMYRNINININIENNINFQTKRNEKFRKNVYSYTYGPKPSEELQKSSSTLNSLQVANTINTSETNLIIENALKQRPEKKSLFFVKKIKSKSNRSSNPLQQYKRSSNFRGVSKNGVNWQVLIMLEKKLKYFGCFKSQEEAALVYDILGIKYQGTKVKTNFMYSKEEIDFIKRNEMRLNN